mgnify:CR=1 FL=1
MSLAQTLLAVKTESTWPKKRKVNKLINITLKKQSWGRKSGTNISLRPLHHANYIAYSVRQLPQYPLSMQQFNYFIFYKHLLNTFKYTRTECKSLVSRLEHIKAGGYLRLL